MATACQHAAMTIVPAAVGLAFLGDEARAGLEWLAFAGFVLTLASVLGLTLIRSRPAPMRLAPPGATPCRDPLGESMAGVLLPRLRVFLTSPGDVGEERAIVRTFLQQLPTDPFVRDRATIELVAWDSPGGGAPMLAARTPQASIDAGLPRPSECDIVIAVFWGRIGTPLPHPEYARSDGTAYESGSVWELEEALDTSRRIGRPDVLIYRRLPPHQVDLTTPDADDRIAQFRGLEAYFETVHRCGDRGDPHRLLDLREARRLPAAGRARPAKPGQGRTGRVGSCAARADRGTSSSAVAGLAVPRTALVHAGGRADLLRPRPRDRPARQPGDHEPVRDGHRGERIRQVIDRGRGTDPSVGRVGTSLALAIVRPRHPAMAGCPIHARRARARPVPADRRAAGPTDG